MGDRYSITADKTALEERLKVIIPDHYKPKFNAAPTQLLPVLTQESEGLSYFYWGQIPGWSKNKALSKKLLFAEKQFITEKASLRSALATRRCLIPVDGYYEWKRISKKGKVAHRIVYNEGDIMGLAGLWEEFEDDIGEIAHTFKFLTVPSNGLIKPMNDQMPVLVKKDSEKNWLSSSEDVDSMVECLEDLVTDKVHIYSVSPKVEDPANDGAELIQPFAPADQFGNYSLFD